MDDVGMLKVLQDEPFVALKERDLIETLKETMQSPPPKPFQKDHITWLPHVAFKHGLYKQTQIVIFPWDQLQDCVQGEHNNLEFPCKFTRTKEHKLCNPPNTLTHLRTNFMLLVIRWWNKQHNIWSMLVFVLHFYFGLNFWCVLFWFFIFGIVNHIANVGNVGCHIILYSFQSPF